MKPNFNLQKIRFVREYVEKHVSILSTKEVIEELCAEAEELWTKNQFYRDKLLEIEQEQDPDKRWENIIAAKLDRAIIENNKKDYLEITNSTNNGIFVITIQRKFGQTPEQLCEKSDIRRAKAEEKIENLLRENLQLQSRLRQSDDELRIMRAIKSSEWDEFKTSKDLETAIDMINSLIKQHNDLVYRKRMSNLTSSMQSSVYEAWGRFAESDLKAKTIQKELTAIKAKLLCKNVERSKFGKYRKKFKNLAS